LGTYYTRIYELPQDQQIVDALLLLYAIVVTLIFVMWLWFVIRMYNKLKD